jgi:hypothetical protein
MENIKVTKRTSAVDITGSSSHKAYHPEPRTRKKEKETPLPPNEEKHSPVEFQKSAPAH